MIIRKYQSSDCKALTDLFYHTVHTVNVKDYTKEQLAVWATGNVDLAQWDKSFLEHYSLVAVQNHKITGFGDIDKTGYLDRLYVHKDYQNQGIASAFVTIWNRLFLLTKLFLMFPLQQNHFSWAEGIMC